MQTPGHIIINLGLLGGRDNPEALGGLLRNRSRWNWAIIIGALLPDILMFWFFVWVQIKGVPSEQIWTVTYFLDGWQNIFAPFNSIPLALIGLAIALYYKRGAIAALFASMALHCLADLPLHNDDAHRHFWPFSDFRFVSPVSYWDPAHHAEWGALFEVVCVLGATALALRWVKSRWGRGILVFLAVLYVALYGGVYGPMLFN